MGEREIVGSTDPCAIPKWAPKKQLRYEVDDFIVSPPSNEDGGFFHLRFGRRTSPRPSTYDRINKELSMTVEIKDGDPLISGVSLVGASEHVISTPTIEVTPTGLYPSVSPVAEAESSSSHSTKPLFVFHLRRDSKATAEDPGNIKDIGDTSTSDVLSSSLSQIYLENPEASNASAEKKNELTPAPERDIRKLTPDRPMKSESSPKESMSVTNIGLLEKVQTLPVASPVETTPYTTPLTTPHTSPHSKRKVYGVVMEQQSSAPHSYFCTKPFMGSQQGSEASQSFASGHSEVTLSETSARMTQQLETSSQVAMAMDPGQKITKKRRPKPSALREMNFWAPTSM